MAVAGNLHNWLKDGDSGWHYNIQKLTVGAGVVYGYLAVLPICLYGVMRLAILPICTHLTQIL